MFTRFFAALAMFFAAIAISNARVMLGIDVLEANHFDILRGKRVGLITNQTGVDSSGVKTRKILHAAAGLKLVALFTPEHGLDGTEKAGGFSHGPAHRFESVFTLRSDAQADFGDAPGHRCAGL